MLRNLKMGLFQEREAQEVLEILEVLEMLVIANARKTGPITVAG